MRKLLGTLTLALLIFGGIGLFRGWFSVSTNTESDQTKIEFQIDKDRLKQDTDRLKDGVHNLSEKVKSASGSDKDDANSIVLPPGSQDSEQLVLPPQF